MGPFYAQIYRTTPLDFVLNEDRNKVELLRRGTRPGERSVVAFIEEMLRRGTLVPGDLLVTDNEKAWLTADVDHLLATHSIDRLFYPQYPSTRSFAVRTMLGSCWRATWICSGASSCLARFTTPPPQMQSSAVSDTADCSPASRSTPWQSFCARGGARS